jgi:hypothetical protein
MRLKAGYADALNKLEAWRAIEYFTIQSAPWERLGKNHPHITNANDQLPWQYSASKYTATSGNKWVSYSGIYSVTRHDELLRSVLKQDRFKDDPPRNKDAALVSLSFDEQGKYINGSLILSQAAWALGRALRPGPDDPEWLDGFLEIQDSLNCLAGTYQKCDNLWRSYSESEYVWTSEGKSWDAEMLTRFITEASAILGIESLNVRANDHHFFSMKRQDLSDSMLNSFYAPDLARVHKYIGGGNELGTALFQYIHPPKQNRVDVLDQGSIDEIGRMLSAAKVPRGKWPGNPLEIMSEAQQFAVNLVLDDFANSNQVQGINGPPGTGKTLPH